jgi:hypothetical protein
VHAMPTLRFLYAGDVTREAGVYRVLHCSGHKSDAEIFLDRGLYLPDCKECEVKYERVSSTSLEQHVSRSIACD